MCFQYLAVFRHLNSIKEREREQFIFIFSTTLNSHDSDVITFHYDFISV